MHACTHHRPRRLGRLVVPATAVVVKGAHALLLLLLHLVGRGQEVERAVSLGFTAASFAANDAGSCNAGHVFKELGARAMHRCVLTRAPVSRGHGRAWMGPSGRLMRLAP
jgi:hypothetical protein